jgi:hypothetical protein
VLTGVQDAVSWRRAESLAYALLLIVAMLNLGLIVLTITAS